MSTGSLLKLENICKSFPGVKALNNIVLEVGVGEVHCICGENGAGKSTLIKIISGAYQPDSGSIFFEGNQVKLNPKSAIDFGIQTIYQEHVFFKNMSVVENIFTGMELTKNGFVKKEEMFNRTKKVLEYLQSDINPLAKMFELSSGEQKLVEIAKSLVFRRKLVILDEPTSSFSAPEIENLLNIVKKISNDGIAIIYISHHLDEVFKIADKITILRDGENISCRDASEIDEAMLIRDMVGRDASAFYKRDHYPAGETVLEVKNLTGNGVKDISFDLRQGEVLGFAGMVGSGRSELMNMIFGAVKPDSGKIFVRGEEKNFRSPKDAIKEKMCFITEDRQGSGLFLGQSIAKNTIIVNLANDKRKFIDPQDDIKIGDEYIKKMGTRASDSNVKVVNLSGGNQQKVVLAKWFLSKGEIFIFDEPTRGIDVGAKQEIYGIMMELLKEGKAIIMVSSDMPEVVSMSDRIVVMNSGKLAATLEQGEISEENILLHSIKGGLE